MLEVLARLAAMVVLTVAAFATGHPDPGVAWRVGLVVAGYSGFAYLLERRGLRNGGVAGLVAILDALAASALLGAANALDSLGFLVAIPAAHAATRFGANALQAAAPSAATLFVADRMLGSGEGPSLLLMAHAGAVLAFGLGLHRIMESRPQAEPEQTTLSDDLGLRERFRQLRDAYRDLEIRSRRDHFLADLWELWGQSGTGFTRALCKLLAHHARVEKLVIYSYEPDAGAMVPRGSAGDIPSPLQELPLTVSLEQARILIREQALRSFQGHLPEQDRDRAANVLLTQEGQVVGLVTIVSDDRSLLLTQEGQVVGLVTIVSDDRSQQDASVSLLEDVSEATAEALLRSRIASGMERQTRHLELLLRLKSHSPVPSDDEPFAKALLAELRSILEPHDAGFFIVQGGEPLLVAGDGIAGKLIDRMAFRSGAGTRGWLESGAPELLVPDLASDARCPAGEAQRQRVGSLCAIALDAGKGVFGFLAMSTRRPYGISATDAEVIRTVSTELARLLKPKAATAAPTGLAAPAVPTEELLEPEAFRSHVQTSGGGHIVHFEVIKWESFGDDCGVDELRRSLRQFARRVARNLPEGGVATVGKVGMAAFLPAGSSVQPAVWASEAAAAAPLIGVRRFDGGQRPLAMRVRTAALPSRVSAAA